MAFKLRPTAFFYYRIIFVILTFCIGFACLAAVVLELMAANAYVTHLQQDSQMQTLSIAGVAGMLGGALMLYLLKDRREINQDRRKKSVPIDFPDRRASVERRVT